MAKRAARKTKTPAKGGLWPRWRRLLLRGLAGLALAVLALVLLFAVVNPPTNIYMMQESRRLGGVTQDWVDWDDIAPVMARSVVAAEDANFCLHWGFDMGAIRQAIDAGGNRGASTLSQQVVKNVFLWHGRNYTRKAAEALLTPVVETVWSKRRILEVYLNVAEFGEGIFGIKAAAARHFQVEPSDLTPVQAARLAAILPDPKGRDPARPGDFLRRRSASIVDGAETIRADGRAACFED
ncbi:monofunctional biosynthetic peptidoglycan transglycosylase [Szabonella alba]|uniref:Biosynthetic peptidoglycan transglycosylase n=1 Tax=Szabonella alba TaxID=2804194 RepID=A0A8K0XZZ7_9RHOB|nr:monofunctional biosynthetic peptidoglycan transglycosylase [Szabonella alba]MBL4916563.1 monofunctional biosynthetic peptidoglycan transglycosylase [Szabonella alba]